MQNLVHFFYDDIKTSFFADVTGLVRHSGLQEKYKNMKYKKIANNILKSKVAKVFKIIFLGVFLGEFRLRHPGKRFF